MLSRESISSGAYLDSFNTLPKDVLWSRERIESSLEETLRNRPNSDDIWIFGYGSLIWNPLLNFDKQEIATLQGWRRSFCIRLIAGRGSEQTPGRMLALELGGFTEGVVLRLPKATINEELRIVWIREMLAGSYRPTWATVTLAGGREVMAIVFVADPMQQYHEKDSSISTIAPLIDVASGPYGTNVDYVHKLAAAMAERGLKDDYVAMLVSELTRLDSLK